MNFIASKEKGGICLFGAPFDSTASFRPGSRFAPQAIREASYALETYSFVQGIDLEDLSFFDDGNLELPFGDPCDALGLIEDKIARIISNGSKPFLIGGEHLVTLGAFRSARKSYPDIKLVHIDAHADLRDEYLGKKLSHATVVRRISEITELQGIKQIGVRSVDRSEISLADELNSNLTDVLKWAQNSPLYITCDLDVLDPSVLPGTGTPEPGGMTFNELNDLLLALIEKLDVEVIDIVELSPMYDISGTSSVVAAKLVRECLIAIGRKAREVNNGNRPGAA